VASTQHLLCLAKAAGSRLPRHPNHEARAQLRCRIPSDSRAKLPAQGSQQQLLPLPFGTRLRLLIFGTRLRLLIFGRIDFALNMTHCMILRSPISFLAQQVSIPTQ
jgi:hypothetical protein